MAKQSTTISAPTRNYPDFSLLEESLTEEGMLFESRESQSQTSGRMPFLLGSTYMEQLRLMKKRAQTLSRVKLSESNRFIIGGAPESSVEAEELEVAETCAFEESEQCQPDMASEAATSKNREIVATVAVKAFRARLEAMAAVAASAQPVMSFEPTMSFEPSSNSYFSLEAERPWPSFDEEELKRTAIAVARAAQEAAIEAQAKADRSFAAKWGKRSCLEAERAIRKNAADPEQLRGIVRQTHLREVQRTTTRLRALEKKKERWSLLKTTLLFFSHAKLHFTELKMIFAG